MPTSITIRNVSDETHAELSARAKATGQSLQEYLRGRLDSMAQGLDAHAWVARVRARKESMKTGLTTEQILEYRDLDRR